MAVFAVQRATPATEALSPTSSGGTGGPAAVDGSQVTPDKLRGSDTILWFTTTYCVPCQIGAVQYQPLDKELGDKAPTMLFVFVDPQEPDAALRGFRTKFGLPEWAMAMDTDRLAQRAGVQVLDTKIFVDEKGIVRDINTPPVNDAYLASIRLLATEAWDAVNSTLPFAFGAGTVSTVNPCGFAMLAGVPGPPLRPVSCCPRDVNGLGRTVRS